MRSEQVAQGFNRSHLRTPHLLHNIPGQFVLACSTLLRSVETNERIRKSLLLLYFSKTRRAHKVYAQKALKKKRKLQQQETTQNTCNIEKGDTLQASGILREMALTFIFIKAWFFQTGCPRDQAPPCIHRTSIKTCSAPVVLNNAS